VGFFTFPPFDADNKTVCGCMGVTKGSIIQAIHEKSVNTLAQLKECTRASTRCGSCTSLCQQLLKAVAPEFQEESKKVLWRVADSSSDFEFAGAPPLAGFEGWVFSRAPPKIYSRRLRLDWDPSKP
jgi:bacterioferritin-associated ferredoxin